MTAEYPKVKSCIVPLDLKQAMTKDYEAAKTYLLKDAVNIVKRRYCCPLCFFVKYKVKKVKLIGDLTY